MSTLNVVITALDVFVHAAETGISDVIQAQLDADPDMEPWRRQALNCMLGSIDQLNALCDELRAENAEGVNKIVAREGLPETLQERGGLVDGALTREAAYVIIKKNDDEGRCEGSRALACHGALGHAEGR